MLTGSQCRDEPDEVFPLLLSNPDFAVLGEPSIASVTITGPAPPELPAIQFSSGSYSVAEDENSATITITRTGDLSVQSTVRYATSDGTATAGSDYVPTSGTVTFAPGEASRTFAVPVQFDAVDEPDETVTLTLSDAGGATLGTPWTATLVITNASAANAIPTLSGLIALSLAVLLALAALLRLSSAP